MNFFYQSASLNQLIPSGAQLASSLKFGAYFFLFLMAGAVAIFVIRTLMIYRYRGEVYIRRQQDWDSKIPQARILEGKAGYVKKKGSMIFRIRYGLLPWQVIDIRKLPNPKYMVGNKAYFLQLNVGELLQAKKVIDWSMGGIEIIPVSNTTKDGAKQDLGTYNQILTASRITPQLIAMASMAMILVTGIIVLYFVSQG